MVCGLGLNVSDLFPPGHRRLSATLLLNYVRRSDFQGVAVLRRERPARARESVNRSQRRATSHGPDRGRTARGRAATTRPAALPNGHISEGRIDADCPRPATSTDLQGRRRPIVKRCLTPSMGPRSPDDRAEGTPGVSSGRDSPNSPGANPFKALDLETHPWMESAADLLAEDDPGPTPYLVEGLIVDRAVTAIQGPYKVGKTWIVLYLGIAIVTGAETLCLHRRRTRPRPTCWRSPAAPPFIEGSAQLARGGRIRAGGAARLPLCHATRASGSMNPSGLRSSWTRRRRSRRG